MPATVRWLGLALLGILIAAGVSIAASRLASQQIGLASEPISAGDALAPVARTHAKPKPVRHRSGKGRRATAPTTPAPPVTTVPPPQPTVPPSTSSPVPASPGGRSSGDGGDHGAGGGADD